MNTYRVLKIKMAQNNLVDMFELIKRTVKYNKIYFEITELDEERAKKRWKKFNYKKFMHIHVREHIDRNSSDREAILYSNLNHVWEWENKSNNLPLSEEEASMLIEEINKSTYSDYSTFLIVFDGVEWIKDVVIDGTYGYKKVKSYNEQGYNYLSNSIIISKDTFKRRCTAYVSCIENCYNSGIMKSLIEKLGTISEIKTYCAPSDELERNTWNKCYEAAKKVFEDTQQEINNLLLKLPHKIQKVSGFGLDTSAVINTRKLAKSIFESNGWVLQKNNIGESGINYVKNIADAKFIVCIDSIHKGHYLQTLWYFESVKFLFGENICYCVDIVGEQESRQYLENVFFVMEHAYNKIKKIYGDGNYATT